MFSYRMMAVAAVFALAVPALGAALPIIEPPAFEQLVEGHTVFTVIEVFRNTTTIRAEFAAAVAVLVREYDAAQRQVRFPGVLWFNDQYLTNPTQAAANAQNFRYPCGGAVMAVNAGDDDPRVILANVGSSGETRDAVTSYEGALTPPAAGGTGVDYGDDSNTVYGGPGPDPTPADDTDDPTFAWANVTTDGATPTANSDTVVTSLTFDPTGGALPSPLDTFDYQESYIITDPNDHVWIIDKYLTYSRVGTSTIATPGGPFTPVYQRPVWVVNILGSPVFIPDDGIASCGPYNDLVSKIYAYAPSQAQGGDVSAADDAVGSAWDPVTQSSGTNPAGVPQPFPMPRRDTPPAGYAEPGQNGYCYNGNFDGDDDGVADCPPGATSSPAQPIRLYNALLYFKLADLDPANAGAPRFHDDQTDDTDTNGCQVGTEWECPGDDDDREGNSHPFHPTPGATTGPGSRNPANGPHTDGTSEDFICPGYPPGSSPLPNLHYNGEEATNHGGSAKADAGVPPYCDNVHATRNVDIYFSPAGRPFAPLVRNFAITDLEGQSQAFHDAHPTHASP